MYQNPHAERAGPPTDEDKDLWRNRLQWLASMGEAITLRVAEAFQQDIGLGTARLDVGTRQRLKVGVGDIVEIRGRKLTAAVVNRAQQDDEGKNLIRVEAVVRRNAGVSIGDRVIVQRIDCPIAETITIAPIYSGSAKMDLGPGLEAFVSKALSRRPFVRGDVFVIPGVFLMGGSLPFMVVSTQPKATVQVGPTTQITIKDETVTETEVAAPRVAYEDIGGLKEKLGRVREMIELPLKHPELFDRLAISPPKGVLLYGPPGHGQDPDRQGRRERGGGPLHRDPGPEIDLEVLRRERKGAPREVRGGGEERALGHLHRRARLDRSALGRGRGRGRATGRGPTAHLDGRPIRPRQCHRHRGHQP